MQYLVLQYTWILPDGLCFSHSHCLFQSSDCVLHSLSLSPFVLSYHTSCMFGVFSLSVSFSRSLSVSLSVL